MLKRFIFLLPVLAVFCGAVPADTETSREDPVQEEVLVSALRDSSAREIAASVTQLSREEIDAAALGHAQELIAQVPNMNLSGEGSRARYFQLRGIGELEQYEGAPNPSVGFIVDDIDLSGVGGIASLFDVDRVEVLRGPQATRFGANAIGGLVYIQSASEVHEPEFEARLTVGNDDTRSTSVSAGGALGKGLEGRFSAQHLRSNGFYQNAALDIDNSNERNETVMRSKLGWAMSDQWHARLSLLLADFDNGYDAWAPDNGRTTYSDNPGRDEQRTHGASLKIEGALGTAVDLVSISGFADSRILFSYDGEWGDSHYWAPYVYDYVYQDHRDRKTLSQELRLLSTPESRILNDRADWLLGVYVQRLDESNGIVSSGVYDDSADAPFAYCMPCVSDTRLDSAFESRNLALFGKLDIDLSERSRLSAGLRAERWQADYSDQFRDLVYGEPGAAASNRFEPSETLWGGELGLTIDLSDQTRFYALVSRGYKAGGFNPSFARLVGSASLDSSAISYQPESLLNIEAGVRGSWLGGSLSASLSLFHMQRHDMQLRSSAQFTDNPNDFIFITSNASGRSRGFESSLQWQLTERLSLHSSLGILSTRIDDYTLQREAGIEGALNGRSFAHAPSWNSNIGLAYRTADDRWQVRLDWQAMDGFYFDYSHDEQATSRSLVNLVMKRRLGSWEFSAWARNLFDRDYHSRGFYFGLAPPLFPRERFTRLGDPRHYGLNATYRY